MTLGIAIPTYKEHLPFLDRLLWSIGKSTVLPDEVYISASEVEDYSFYPENDYGLNLIINITKNKRNPAHNTNFALGNLTTDIYSVIGGDDMVHPQRNEFILRAFEDKSVQIIVHNFKQSLDIDMDFLNTPHKEITLMVDYIDTILPNCIYPTSAIEQPTFANAFISFRRYIFDKFQYDESVDAEFLEDSLYNRNLVMEGYKISYIKEKLALYLKNPIRPNK